MGEDLPGCEQDIHGKVSPEEVELVRREYTANGGWETFLSYEDVRQDILIGLLRLRRLPGRPLHRARAARLRQRGRGAPARHLQAPAPGVRLLPLEPCSKLSLGLTSARMQPLQQPCAGSKTPEHAKASPASSMCMCLDSDSLTPSLIKFSKRMSSAGSYDERLI